MHISFNFYVLVISGGVSTLSWRCSRISPEWLCLRKLLRSHFCKRPKPDDFVLSIIGLFEDVLNISIFFLDSSSFVLCWHWWFWDADVINKKNFFLYWCIFFSSFGFCLFVFYIWRYDMLFDEFFDANYYAAFFNRLFVKKPKVILSIVLFFKILSVKFPFYSKICYVLYHFMLHRICCFVFYCFF